MDGLSIDVFDFDFLERTIFSALDAFTYIDLFNVYYINITKINNCDLLITLSSATEMFWSLLVTLDDFDLSESETLSYEINK